MKKKNIFLIIILLLFIVFLSIIKNFKVENIIKDIIYYPYNIFLKDKKIELSDDFLHEQLSNKEMELNELKELLNIDLISDYNIVYSTVINRNLEYFYDELVINKGSSDGIKINSIVITKDGLLGKVVDVNINNSTVKLITSRDIYNMLSVQINLKDKYIYGILKSYDEKTNSFVIEGIDENINIEVGSSVSTTGLGLYPSGILIGKVVRIQKDNFDLSYIVKVEPIVDFDNFHYVGVLIPNV